MTLRLGDLVVSGEIDNTRPYSVCGWVKLRGQDHPLTLNLTGDAGAGLKGLRVRFEAAGRNARQEFVSEEMSERLAWQQVGPTGLMSIGPDRFGREAISLEWHSQNGRVLLVLPCPALEVLPDEDDDDSPFAGIDDGDGDDEHEHDLFYGAADGDDFDVPFGPAGFFDEDADDPYGLFPPELQDHLDDEADQVDRDVLPMFGDGSFGDLPFGDLPFGDGEFDDGDEDDLFAAQLERLEELIESGAGTPISQIFDPPLRLRPATQLDDDRVETALKLLLARLAEHGISLDVCEHYTPRQAYRYLLEDVCPNEVTHPELDATRWVQHFSTRDTCPACEAEFEKEYEEYERNRGRDEDDDDVIPF